MVKHTTPVHEAEVGRPPRGGTAGVSNLHFERLVVTEAFEGLASDELDVEVGDVVALLEEDVDAGRSYICDEHGKRGWIATRCAVKVASPLSPDVVALDVGHYGRPKAAKRHNGRLPGVADAAGEGSSTVPDSTCDTDSVSGPLVPVRQQPRGGSWPCGPLDIVLFARWCIRPYGPGQLELQSGEPARLVERLSADWLRVRNGAGRSGLVPSAAMAELLETSEHADVPQASFLRVRESFITAQLGEVPVDDVLVLVEYIDSNWVQVRYHGVLDLAPVEAVVTIPPEEGVVLKALEDIVGGPNDDDEEEEDEDEAEEDEIVAAPPRSGLWKKQASGGSGVEVTVSSSSSSEAEGARPRAVLHRRISIPQGHNVTLLDWPHPEWVSVLFQGAVGLAPLDRLCEVGYTGLGDRHTQRQAILGRSPARVMLKPGGSHSPRRWPVLTFTSEMEDEADDSIDGAAQDHQYHQQQPAMGDFADQWWLNTPQRRARAGQAAHLSPHRSSLLAGGVGSLVYDEEWGQWEDLLDMVPGAAGDGELYALSEQEEEEEAEEGNASEGHDEDEASSPEDIEDVLDDLDVAPAGDNRVGLEEYRAILREREALATYYTPAAVRSRSSGYMSATPASSAPGSQATLSGLPPVFEHELEIADFEFDAAKTVPAAAGRHLGGKAATAPPVDDSGFQSDSSVDGAPSAHTPECGDLEPGDECAGSDWECDEAWSSAAAFGGRPSSRVFDIL